MSNSNQFERLWKLQTQVNRLVLDGKRDPEKVADTLQIILEESQDSVGITPAEPTSEFAELVDLGIITVPSDYDHTTAIAKFIKKNRKKFYDVSNNITDANFPNPSRILKPGDKLWVRGFQQIVGGTTTSAERMAFIASQNGFHTGAQGSSLVFEQKRDLLPKGKWYASFDEPARLWEDADGDHWVPDVDAGSDGSFYWSLGHFEYVWRDRNAFLVFCDPPQSLVA